MAAVGFSTGAISSGDVRRGLDLLRNTTANAVELSALRQNELPALVALLGELDLEQFDYVSVHAPSALEPEYENTALELLARVQERGWPIIVHPDAMHNRHAWARFGESLYVENMDIRKPIGQTASHLAAIFSELPQASLCLDLSHARQVDPTMSEAAQNPSPIRKPAAPVACMASRRVASLIPQNVPIILESRVAEPDIQKEMDQRRPRARQHRGAGDCRRLVASPGYGLLIFLS